MNTTKILLLSVEQIMDLAEHAKYDLLYLELAYTEYLLANTVDQYGADNELFRLLNDHINLITSNLD